MASEDPQAGTPDGPSESTQSPRPLVRAPWRLTRAASILLVAGAVAQIVTLDLPWEHLDIVSEHRAMDLDTSMFITTVPLNEVFFTSRTSPHPMLAAIFWDVLWRGALLFIGLWLVLAFFSAKRPVIRWSFAALYGLWLAYTTVLALAFARTVQEINNGTFTLSAHPIWWAQYVRVVVTQAGTGGNPLSPAWGFWMFVGALVICWLALGLTIYTLIRGGGWRNTLVESTGTERARKLPLAAILVTAGAAVWIASYVALPMAVADCGRPLESLAASEVPLLCEEVARVYPLQVSVYGVILQPVLQPPRSLVDFDSPGNQVLRELGYFRSFALLALAMAATPLALVAAWRARPTRGQAAWLSAWAALVLAEIGFLLSVMAELYFSNPRPIADPIFAESIGPAAVLMPLGVALVVAGVALYWRAALRGGPGAAPTVETALSVTQSR